MIEKSTFHCFRGIMLFSNQRNLFSFGLEDNKETKNKLFRDFFLKLSYEKKFFSNFSKMEYVMLYKNTYFNITHFQLARKSEYNKRELVETEIIEEVSDDYPYVNVFVELSTQKFMIELNSKTFDNYETPARIIKNIINNNIGYNDLTIEINPLVVETDFWNLFETGKKIYSIEFNLDVPNLFNMCCEVEKMLDEARRNVNADKLKLTLSNKEGNIEVPNRDGISSYVNFANSGGGKWAISRDENGSRHKFTSDTFTRKVVIDVDKLELNVSSLSAENINIIIDAMEKIENVENLKRKEN